METNKIIKLIKDICLKYNVNNKMDKLHNSLLINIKLSLLKNNFEVYLEKPIVFNYVRLSDKSKYLRNGFIDLIAIKDNNIIGIEFDAHNTLKNKSIEKLLQSNCNICIGIIRGSMLDSDYRSIVRIEENLSKGNFKNKNFFLINLYQNTLKQIY